MKRVEYRCLDCGRAFGLEIGAEEERGALSASRREACPGCGRLVGAGTVQCRKCGGKFVLRFPHWHVRCDLASGTCPHCGETYVSPCIC